MKHHHRPKSLRKKYKRIVATMAGAAVLSSAMLPGLPVTKVQAQETQDTNRTEVNKAESPNTSTSPLNAARKYAQDQGYDANRNNLSLQWSTNSDASVLLRQDDGNAYRVRLNKDENNRWAVNNLREVDRRANYLRDPVETVKDNAASLGFDTRYDRFTLLSIAGSKAIVQVRHGGQTFKVDLIKKGSGWDITTVRGIGDMNHPATYTPVSFLPATAVSTISPAQNVLYQTNTYTSWAWNETTYPNDMTLGVILQNPQLATATIPPDILNKIANINFNNQFVVFAYLGNVPPRGYGIGIERIVQAGNAITVTVHTKSPNNAADLPQSKYSDYITIDRAALRNASQVHITFVDQTGRTLNNYTMATK